MSYPTYPRYKDSGVPWLGEVPEHWALSLVKRQCDVALGKMLDQAKQNGNGVRKPYLRAANILWDRIDVNDVNQMEFTTQQLDRYRLLRGDLLVTEGGVTVGRSAMWREELEECYYQNSLNRVRPLGNSNLSTRFLLYWLHFTTENGYVDLVAEKSTFGHLTNEKLMAFPLLVPASHTESDAIVAFLDRETAEIDAMIAKQEELIALLREKRQAVISHAVTKGLNPDAPMKDSGVPWLGEVPAHWEVARNKVLFQEIDERSDDGDEELLTVSHLTGITPRSEKNVNMIMAETLEGYKKCHKGDLVINTMWAWMGALGISPLDGVVSPSYNVYRPRHAQRLNPGYYDHLYRTSQHVVEMKANSSGVWESRLRLYPDAFLSMRSPVPPQDEQAQIARHIANVTVKLDSLIAKAEQAIDLLRERRTALISAAVTGKIDVRVAANSM